MKVLIPQEVSSKQVVTYAVAALFLIASFVLVLMIAFSQDAQSAERTPSTTNTVDVERFDKPPHPHVIATPIAVAKPTIKPTPKPKPKPVVVTHKTVVKKTVVQHHYVNNGKCGATCQWAKTASVWKKYPAWVQTFALCVAHHESWSPHMWTAENPYSTASGGFQWIDGSWQVNMHRAGFSGPGHAAYATPTMQASVTAWVITHNGQRNWAGSGCGYGT